MIENLPTTTPSPTTTKTLPKTTVIYIGVALLFIVFVFISAVAISQRQQSMKGSVSPTAPESQPAAAEPSSTSCDLVFTVQ